MSSKFSKGALVWVKHPTEAWQPATVNEVLPRGKLRVFFANGDNDVIRVQPNYPLLRTIRCEGDIELSEAVKKNEEELLNDDLTKMTQLVTPAVLYSLHKSYNRNRFYSKLGSGTILALNPFKDVPELFTLKSIQSYHSVSLSELQSLPAHVYAAAQNALVTLRASVGKVNQSIIVSGESGAGKTWTVRCLMRYLAEVGIEYKRRLSSADLSSSPLKGFHSSPMRSELKGVTSGDAPPPTFDLEFDPAPINGFEGTYTIHDVNAGGDVKVNGLDCNQKVGDLMTSSSDDVMENSHQDNVNWNNNNEKTPGQISSEMTAGDPSFTSVQNIATNSKSVDTLRQNHKINPEISINDSLASENLDIDYENDVDLNVSIQIVDRIERRILYSNPILEAFGNASTLRNENSSRFGKYIQLQYDRSGTIVGAQLRTYLLEKTRAVRHDPGEQSYHIFYQMLHGATTEEKKEWQLPDCPFPEDISESSSIHSDEEDTSSTSLGDPKKLKMDFEETQSSMSRIGISDQTQTQLFKLLSSVLHLRLLTFEGTDDLQTACTLDPENPTSERSLLAAAELLGVEPDAIMKAITFREITAHSNRRKSIFHRPCTVEECKSRRDSLAKLIYEILFRWIVQRIGDSVCAPKDKWCSFIGLLDIYGFESFENNSLEQLCINYANEKLQQHFVASFLREQQEEYLSEGVSWTHCDLTDNVECLLALEAPRNSLFSLLNEECRLNRSNANAHLKSRVESMFKRSRHVVQPRISKKAPSFSVVHYAGPVSYTTQDLIEKNKDEVPPEITQLLTSSEVAFVYELMTEGRQTPDSDLSDLSTSGGETVTQNKGKHRPTVLTRFKKSLDELLDTLGSTDCHYIRCIKPNKQSVPDVFDSKFVLDQLEACGVVETIRVCAPAHPNKMSYNEFIARYRFLLRIKNVEDTKREKENTSEKGNKKRRCLTNVEMRREACERILKALQEEEDRNNNKRTIVIDEKKDPIQFGKTMIFMSSELFESLESARSKEIVKCATTVQKAWRDFVTRRQCRAARKMLIARRESASSLLQRVWKRRISIRKSRAERRALIQQRKDSVIRIQRCWMLHRRRMEGRRQREMMLKKRQEAAVAIQAVYRGWRIRCRYKDLMDAWRQLKIIEEEEYRAIVQQRLRDLLRPQLGKSSFPSYEAIKATFELPKPKVRSTPKSKPPTIPKTPNQRPPQVLNGSAERLTVYYDETISKKVVVKENVVLDDLDLDFDDRHSGSPGSHTCQSSPTHDQNHSGVAQDLEFEIQRPLRSTGIVKHAKLMRSSTSLDREDRVKVHERSSSMPRLPSGPGVIYAWHNRAPISMMTPKRPMSLSSDPLTLLEMQYNQSGSVLTTPFSSLHSSKRSHGRRGRHRHSYRHSHNRSQNQSASSLNRYSDRHTHNPHNQSASSFNRIAPSGYTWSPGYFRKVSKGGRNCILKYADVAPKISVK